MPPGCHRLRHPRSERLISIYGHTYCLGAQLTVNLLLCITLSHAGNEWCSVR
jgi:hypothetical protein